MRAFRKTGEQTMPDYLLKKFSAKETENFDVDPYADLRAGHGERVAKIRRDKQRFGTSDAPAQKPDWERVVEAETYKPGKVREATASMETADPSCLSGHAVRRVETGSKFDNGLRGAITPHSLFMTAGESYALMQEMDYLGIPLIDPTFERLASEFTSYEDETGQRQMLDSKRRTVESEIDVAREYVRKGHAQRESLRTRQGVGARNGGLLPNGRQINRAGEVEPVVGRFAQKLDAQLSMLAERDEVRREEVEKRMERRAKIRGVDHKTPAERHKDWESEVQLHGTRRGDTTSFIDKLLENF